MGSDNITFFMIFACFAVILFLIFSNHIKIIGKFIINGLIGVIGITIVNYFFIPMGISVGINVITIITSCILGIPGIISLYIISALVL